MGINGEIAGGTEGLARPEHPSTPCCDCGGRGGEGGGGKALATWSPGLHHPSLRPSVVFLHQRITFLTRRQPFNFADEQRPCRLAAVNSRPTRGGGSSSSGGGGSVYGRPDAPPDDLLFLAPTPTMTSCPTPPTDHTDPLRSLALACSLPPLLPPSLAHSPSRPLESWGGGSVMKE